MCFSPFCKGFDLPQLQVLFRHPCLHSDRPGQLGWLLLLGSQSTGAQALPLWSGGFYSWEGRNKLSITLVLHQDNSFTPGYWSFFKLKSYIVLEQMFSFTFGSVSVSKGTNDLPDAVL